MKGWRSSSQLCRAWRTILTAPGDGRDQLGQSDAWVDGRSLKDRCSQCHLNPWQIHLRVVHDNSWSIHMGKTSKFKMQREAEECEKSHLGYLRTLDPVQNAPKTFVPHQKVLIWTCPKPFGMVQMCSWMLWTVSNFKDVNMDQISYEPNGSARFFLTCHS